MFEGVIQDVHKNEPLLPPQWAESKQQTLTIRLTVRDEVSVLLTQIGTALKQVCDSLTQYVRRAMQSFADLFKSLFPRPTHYSKQTRRYLAVKRREQARKARYGKVGIAHHG